MYSVRRNIVLVLVALVCGISAGRSTAEDSAAAPSSAFPPALQKLVSADTPLLKGDRIAFFGDSVTDQGGYIRLMQEAIDKSPATLNLDVKLLKHGLNGGRVPTVLEGKCPWGDLGAPMETLIDKEKPTVVVIYLGINDVWQGEKGTNMADFENGLEKMIRMTKKIGAVAILCTATVIGEETEKNDLTDKLGDYAKITKKLAAANNLTLCDLHASFLDELKKVNKENKHSGNLTYDGVHMKPAGNFLLADEISRSLIAAIKNRAKADATKPRAMNPQHS